MLDILANRYEIKKQLGKKSGRKTLLAKDLQTGEMVIVKLLAINSDFEWEDLKLFEREAQTLKSLSHPCIPRYLDYFEINSPTYQGFALIQTYIPAKTLEQYLQTGRTFSEAEIKEIATAILNIFIYLHELNPPVIHRDIKPSNILLSERSGNSVGKIYLVDFGSVQTIVDSEIGTRTIVGTYGYMPQEQFGGRTVPASDLYSLGATLIYLITGSHPADLPEKDFRIQFEQVTNLSPQLTNWLKRMIEPDLEQRFASANEALIALEQPQDTNITTLNFSKPEDSNIEIIKNKEFLEIAIPSIGFDTGTIFFSLFMIACSISLLNWTIGMARTYIYGIGILEILLFALPFWTLDLIMSYGIIYLIFGKLKIKINHNRISMSNHLNKLNFPRRSILKSKINKLYFNSKLLTIDSDGDKIQSKPQLVIWAGNKKIELIVDKIHIKSLPELEWLAHEISHYLDIPLETE